MLEVDLLCALMLPFPFVAAVVFDIPVQAVVAPPRTTVVEYANNIGIYIFANAVVQAT